MFELTKTVPMNSGGYFIRLQKALRGYLVHLFHPLPQPFMHSYKNTKRIITPRRTGYSQHVLTQVCTIRWTRHRITWKTFIIMSNTEYELSGADRPTLSTHSHGSSPDEWLPAWRPTYISVNMFSILFPGVRWELLGNPERGSIRQVALQRCTVTPLTLLPTLCHCTSAGEHLTKTECVNMLMLVWQPAQFGQRPLDFIFFKMSCYIGPY